MSREFGGDCLQEFISVPTTIAALVFVVIVALINFRGIRESVPDQQVKRIFDEDATVFVLLGMLIAVAIVLWVFNRLLADRTPPAQSPRAQG